MRRALLLLLLAALGAATAALAAPPLDEAPAAAEPAPASPRPSPDPALPGPPPAEATPPALAGSSAADAHGPLAAGLAVAPTFVNPDPADALLPASFVVTGTFDPAHTLLEARLKAPPGFEVGCAPDPPRGPLFAPVRPSFPLPLGDAGAVHEDGLCLVGQEPETGRWTLTRIFVLPKTGDFELEAYLLGVSAQVAGAAHESSFAWNVSLTSTPLTDPGLDNPLGGVTHTEDLLVTADIVAPTVAVLTDPAAPAATGWFRQATEGSLAIVETTSPFLQEYKLSGPDIAEPVWTPYTGAPFALPQGVVLIEARVEDKAGNEGTASLSVKVDHDPPNTVAKIDPPEPSASGWYVDTPKVTFLATDAVSKVDYTEFRVEEDGVLNEAWTKVTGPVEVPDGAAVRLEYRSVDLAGHVEAERWFPAVDVLKVDSQPPVVDIDTVCPSDFNDALWCRGPVTVTLTASDPSAVAVFTCTVDDAPVADCASGTTFDLTEDGVHTVAVHAEDVALNIVDVTATAKIDATEPTVSLSEPACMEGKDDWCVGEATLVLTTGDATSGVVQRTCSVLGAAGPEAPCVADLGLEGDVIVTLSEDGTYTVEATVEDAAGNTNQATTVVKVDKAAPIVTLSAPSCTAGKNGWCTSGATLTLATSDATSGLTARTCDVTDQEDAEAPCQEELGLEVDVTIALDDDGVYTVLATAEDVAGNLREESLEVKVDATAPVVDLSGPACEEGNNGWCIGDATVTLHTADAMSGLTARTCTFDGDAQDEAACAAAVGLEADLEFTLSVDDVYAVSAAAEDEAGNTAQDTLQVKLDATAPIVTLSQPACVVGKNGWCIGDATVTFHTEDATSGVALRTCLVDGEAQDESACDDALGLEDDVDVVLTVDDVYTLTATAEDAAGHTFEATREVRLDATAPQVSFSEVLCTAGKNDWCVGDATVTFHTEDATSGVADRNCAVEGAAQGGLACADELGLDGDVDIVLTIDDVYSLAATVEDAAGHTADTTGLVKLDATDPIVSLSAPSCVEGNDGWCKGDATVTFATSDATSGLVARACTVTGVVQAEVACADPLELEGDVAVVLTEDDVYTFAAGAEDEAGNTAQDGRTVKVDATAPQADIVLDCAQLGEPGWCRSSSYDYEDDVGDATSGIAADFPKCTVDDAPQPCTGTVTGEGTHTLVLVVRDQAGHEVTVPKSLGIDSVAPDLQIIPDCPELGLGGEEGEWCLDPLGYDVLPSDDTSGIDTSTLACTLARGENEAEPAECKDTLSEDGRYLLSVEVTDEAGNPASAEELLLIDQTDPVLDFDLPCLGAEPAKNGWCRSATLDYTITVSDGEGSGVLEDPVTGPIFDCLLDTEDNFVPCDGTLVGPGEFLLIASAVDQAGNDARKEALIKLDDVPPVVALTETCATPGDEGWCLEASVAYGAEYTDADSGPAEGQPTCTINGVEADCAGTLEGDDIYNLALAAEDLAGNPAEDELQVKIDATKPELGLVPGCEGVAGWCTAAGYGYLASATDETSEVLEQTCFVDEAAVPCEDPVAGEGPHTVRLEARDRAGNQATPKSFELGIDTEEPVVEPLALACSDPGTEGWCRAASFTFAGGASDAASGLAEGFPVCSVDGVDVAAGPGACSGEVTGEGPHTVVLRARDVAGHEAGDERELAIDSVAPDIVVSAVCSEPGEGDWCLGALDGLVSLDDETSGPASLACTLDEAPLACDEPWLLDEEGEHALAVEGSDAAGHQATHDAVLRVDLQDPTVALLLDGDVGDGDIYIGPVLATFGCDDPGAGSGCDRTEYLLDGALTYAVGGSVLVDTDGGHTLTVRAVDRAGRVSEEVSVAFTIDSVLPVVAIQAPAPGAVLHSTSVVAAFTADGTGAAIAAVECSLDGGTTFAGCASGEPLLYATHGPSTLVVRATDAAGHSGTASVDFTIVGPVAELVLTPPKAIVVTKRSLTFHAAAFDSLGHAALVGELTWSVEPEGLGTIGADGKLTANATGEGRVRVLHAATGTAAEAPLTVVADASGAAKLVLEPEEATVVAGTSRAFTATAFDADGTIVAGAVPTFELGSARVGSVTSAGVFRGLRTGAVELVARLGSLQDSATITVVPGPLARLRVSPGSAALVVGDQFTLTAEGTDALGNTLASPSVAWSVASGPGTVTAGGVYSATAEGVARVQASSGKVTRTVTVHVAAPVVVAADEVAVLASSVATTTTNDVTTTTYSVGVAEVAAGARMEIQPPSEGAGDGALEGAQVAIERSATQVSVIVETQPGSLEVMPGAIDAGDLVRTLGSDGNAGLFLTIAASENGLQLDSVQLNALLGTVTVGFRMPADYFENGGLDRLDPQRLEIAKYANGERLSASVTARLLGPAEGGFYRFEATMGQFSTFALIWRPPVPASTGGGGGGGGAGGLLPEVTKTAEGTTQARFLVTTGPGPVALPLARADPRFGDLTLQAVQTWPSVRVTASVGPAPPPGTAELPLRYRPLAFLQLAAEAPPGSVGGGALTFALPAADLAGAAPAQVRALAWDGAAWLPLPLAMLGEEAGSARFRASFASTGSLAIAVEAIEEGITLASLLPRDLEEPAVRPEGPPANGFTSQRRPFVSATYTDNEGIDFTRSVLRLDGRPLTGAVATRTGLGALVLEDLADGPHLVGVEAVDTSGNAAAATWTFYVDATAPLLAPLAPPEGGVVRAARPTLRAQAADALSGLDPASLVATVDGRPARAALANGTIAITPEADLAEGIHRVSVEAKDLAGNAAAASWQFAVAEPKPAPFPAALALAAVLGALALLRPRRR